MTFTDSLAPNLLRLCRPKNYGRGEPGPITDSPLLQGAYFFLRSKFSHLASSALQTYYFFFFFAVFFTTFLVAFLAMVDLFLVGLSGIGKFIFPKAFLILD
jgi:hypothetical protein